MDEIQTCINKLKRLQDETTDVRTAAAMVDIASFLQHDLEHMIQLLEQAESKLAMD